jgi:hypothetical protein
MSKEISKDEMMEHIVNALQGLQAAHEKLFRDNHWMEDGQLYVARMTLSAYYEWKAKQ